MYDIFVLLIDWCDPKINLSYALFKTRLPDVA